MPPGGALLLSLRPGNWSHLFTYKPMNNPPVLRLATPADASAIANLYLTTRKQLLPYAPVAHTDDEVRHWIANHLLPHCRVTVAEVKGEIVGFCATMADDAYGWIEQLYLLPHAINQGIGTALLNAALRQLRRPVRLYTFQANSGARRFYERHGFVVIQLGDGSGNEEGVPDVLYELT
jgi:GNAT superfamily N-acetyltransferase